MKRGLYLAGGILAVILGVIGIVLPLLPTTPFILVAAFCFSRSSKTLHTYLVTHPVFGKLISDWENHGVIPLKAKLLGSSMMIIMVSYPLIFKDFHFGLKITVVITILLTLMYIWSRPSKASS